MARTRTVQQDFNEQIYAILVRITKTLTNIPGTQANNVNALTEQLEEARALMPRLKQLNTKSTNYG